MIRPHLTEKTMSEAKKRTYTFLVDRDMDKSDIKKQVEEVYDVHVRAVRTIKVRGGVRKNSRGQKVKVSAQKKAMILLKADEKIDVFEEKKS